MQVKLKRGLTTARSVTSRHCALLLYIHQTPDPPDLLFHHYIHPLPSDQCELRYRRTRGNITRVALISPNNQRHEIATPHRLMEGDVCGVALVRHDSGVRAPIERLANANVVDVDPLPRRPIRVIVQHDTRRLWRLLRPIERGVFERLEGHVAQVHREARRAVGRRGLPDRGGGAVHGGTREQPGRVARGGRHGLALQEVAGLGLVAGVLAVGDGQRAAGGQSIGRACLHG